MISQDIIVLLIKMIFFSNIETVPNIRRSKKKKKKKKCRKSTIYNPYKVNVTIIIIICQHKINMLARIVLEL